MNMKIKKLAAVILFSGVTLQLSGCFDSEPEVTKLPKVNDQNCKPAAVAKVTPDSARQQFAGLCSRRGTAVQTSPEVKW
ncbi:entry exclusion lipoprotein TrbK [Pseudomonas aeruginosa]|uniref:entry exclusion lipoprotein TrbK n=1 Tax=Pseudomonas aeruginosa TaxID=287 RepID=UPI000FEEE704|nr:entry exclusion lipoprotein TrbK [Pseudomonas aeruginosa]RPV83044.1 entry exclusion lipoprotein TrbK [Pseudomonas aeruginosa]